MKVSKIRIKISLLYCVPTVVDLELVQVVETSVLFFLPIASVGGFFLPIASVGATTTQQTKLLTVLHICHEVKVSMQLCKESTIEKKKITNFKTLDH